MQFFDDWSAVVAITAGSASWLSLHPPAPGDGEWAVSLIVHTDSTASETEPGPSLLAIEQLIHRIVDEA